MLRLTRLGQLSRNQFPTGQAASGSWTPHHRKQAFRQGRQELQKSRQRQHLQQERFQQQQAINQQHGTLSRERAKQQRQLQTAAMCLIYGTARQSHSASRLQGGRAAHAPRVTAAERAEDMATARQYLQLSEASRRENKRSRQRRTEEFRAVKKWR